jgi:hypothetical protein
LLAIISRNGEQDEGTISQRTQIEETDQGREVAQQKHEIEEGIEVPQGVESRCETEDGPQAVCSRQQEDR